MHVLLIGAFIGFVLGGMIGGGAFGLLGLFVGGAIGGLTGAVVLPSIALASADEFARHPHIVNCPATGDPTPVTVSRASARAASLHRKQRPAVIGCTRWKEHGRCKGPCNLQLHV